MNSRTAKYERDETHQRQGVRLLVLQKRGERFLFRYREGQRDELLRAISRLALDERLTFSWHDAAALASVLRDQASQRTGYSKATTEGEER